MCKLGGRDHNATSYSTETDREHSLPLDLHLAEIITLRAIALKPSVTLIKLLDLESRDHNATSYSTETAQCEDFFMWSLYEQRS